jgi:hypothetical protein
MVGTQFSKRRTQHHWMIHWIDVILGVCTHHSRTKCSQKDIFQFHFLHNYDAKVKFLWQFEKYFTKNVA